MKFRDLPAAVIGRLGEQLAQRMLRQLGAGVIASFKFSGENDNEAPAIEFHDKRITLPDFDVSMRGSRFWVELKTYKEPQWNRAHRCLVHGVSTRLYEQYIADEKATGTPVFLGVLEVDSGALLVSEKPISLIEPKYTCLCGCENDTEECDYRRKWGNGYPQWYFRRDGFREWAKLAGNDLARLRAEHEKVSHVIRRHGDKREVAPRGVFSAAPPWTWACLVCNVTGTGSSAAHRCAAGDHEYRRNYWLRRITWALPESERERAADLVARPIDRGLAVKLLGPTWTPEADFR